MLSKQLDRASFDNLNKYMHFFIKWTHHMSEHKKTNLPWFKPVEEAVLTTV